MQRLPRWLAAIAIIVFVIGEAFCIYIFILNRRLTRELVNHSWREPARIVSAARGTPMPVATLYGVDWRITPPVTLQSIPAHVSNAFLAAEDVRFHHHIGIDPIGMARALFMNLRAHGIAAGGSTIDQQIIKTRFLSQERTWRRKITEIILAVLLDARMPKNEILEVYLNDVYLGHNEGKPVLGIDEASRLYFNKHPSELRVDEAAVLAGMIRAPNRDTPEKRPDIARARRDAILGVMHGHGWIDDAQFAAARNRDVEFTGGSIPQAPYPFYLRALRAEIVKEIGVRPVIEGALTIVCEMDPDAQRNAERVAAHAPAQLGAAAGRAALRRSAQRRHPRLGRRQRLQRLPLRPHHGHASPAGIRLQNVCIPGRDRIEESDDRNAAARRAGQRGRQRQRNVAAPQLR
jgi:membrane peptidoglycan carboxypeptidase